MRTLAAIARLTATDLALAIHRVGTQFAGIHDTGPLYRRLNSAVARSDANPHLPARYRDPRDVADAARNT